MLVYPKLKPLSLKEINIDEFKGLEEGICADKGSFYYTENISAASLPKLTSRNGRINVFSVPSDEKITGLFSFDKAYATTNYNGTTRLYRGNDFSSLSLVYTAGADDLAASLICKAGGNICLFNVKDEGDGKNLLVLSEEDFSVLARVSTPHFNDAVVYKNRLFGCGRWKVFASAYNDITKWDTEEERIDIEARAFESGVQSEADFTACTVYKGHALFFTTDAMYKLGGNDNATFELVKISNYGCIDRHAICEAGGVLYYVSKDGIISYDGSRVSIAMDKLCGSEPGVTKTVLCGKGKLLYLDALNQYGRCLYGFNTDSGGYVKEDNFVSCCAVRHNGNIFFAKDTEIYRFDVPLHEDDSGNDARDLDWQVVTQDLCKYISPGKRNSKLELGVYMPFGGPIEVFVSYDWSAYKLIHTISGMGCKDVCIPLSRTNYESIRFKFVGFGEGQIYYIRFACNVGAEAN